MADPKGRRGRLFTTGAALAVVLECAGGRRGGHPDATSPRHDTVGSLAAFDFVVDAHDDERWVDPDGMSLYADTEHR